MCVGFSRFEGRIRVCLCLGCLCRVQSIVLDNKHHKEALQNLLMNFGKYSPPPKVTGNCGATL